jgi:hypothetical protein
MSHQNLVRSGGDYFGSRAQTSQAVVRARNLLDIKKDKLFERQSIRGLESKLNMRVNASRSKPYVTHHEKAVQSYLKEWTNGKAVIPSGWHHQIENGKLANNQNPGLIVGRKRCPRCERYRCHHVQFSGGVVDQQRLEFRTSESKIRMRLK